MNTVTLTSKGQFTIPRPLRDALGLAPGARLQASIDRQGRLVRTRGVVVDDIDGVIDALEHWCGGRPCLGSGPYCRDRAREWWCLRVPAPISARRDLHWVLGPVRPSPAEARCAHPVPAIARSGLDAWPCRSAGSAGARGCIGAGGPGPQR